MTQPAVVFLDSDTSEWTTEFVRGEDVLLTSFIPTVDTKRTARRGSIGPIHEHTISVETPTSYQADVTFAHWNSTAAYDPRQFGRVECVEGAFDVEACTAKHLMCSLCIRQGGIFYESPSAAPTKRKWQAFVMSKLYPEDFTRVGGVGPEHPDLSDKGAPLQLGYLARCTFPRQTRETKFQLAGWKVVLVRNKASAEDPLLNDDQAEAVGKVSRGGRSSSAPAPPDYAPLIAAAENRLRRTVDIESEHAAVLAQLTMEREARAGMEAQWTHHLEQVKRALSSEQIPTGGVAAALKTYRQRAKDLDAQLREESARRQRAEAEAAAAAQAKDAAQTQSAQLRSIADDLAARLSQAQRRAEAEAHAASCHRREADEARTALDEARAREEAAELASHQASALHAAQLEEARSEQEDLRRSLSLARELIARHEAVLEAAHAQAEAAAQRVDDLSRAVEELEEKLRAAEALAEDTQRRMEEAEAKAARAMEREVLISAEATAAREEAEASRAQVLQLQQRIDEVEESLREASALSDEALQSEREKVARAKKDAEAARDAYAMEKALREKIATELFAEIDARKEAERRQAYALAALHEQVKRQISAIVELDEALKQEVLLRTRLEEQLEGEKVARAKAEDALHKLDQLFRAAGAEDSDWAIVEDSQGDASPDAADSEPQPQ